MIDLATPGSAVRLASVARHITDSYVARYLLVIIVPNEEVNSKAPFSPKYFHESQYLYKFCEFITDYLREH